MRNSIRSCGAPLRKWTIALLAACALSMPAAAQQAEPPQDLAASVVPQVAAQLKDRYPFPDLAEKYARKLRGELARGSYKGLAGRELAKAVNADLQSVHKDLHLGVHYSHALFLQASAETGGGESQEDAEHQKEERRLANFGFTNVEIDPAHSTAYIKSRGPWWNERETFDTAAGALALAAQSRNVIIDVRDNGGGAGEIGRFLASYFFGDGDERFYLNGFGRDRTQDQQEWTYPYVPGRRLPGARLFILVNARTASASEGFAFAMQKMGRATIVGDTTAGAGIAGSLMPLRDDLVLFLPVKMVVAPHSMTGWEGTGVVPDVPASGRDAREVAQGLIAAGAEQKQVEPRLPAHFMMRTVPVRITLSGREDAGLTFTRCASKLRQLPGMMTLTLLSQLILIA